MVMQKFIIHDIRQIDPAILSICDGHLVEQAFLRLLRALFSQFGIGFAAYWIRRGENGRSSMYFERRNLGRLQFSSVDALTMKSVDVESIQI